MNTPRPVYVELWLILLTGAVHIIVKWFWRSSPLVSTGPMEVFCLALLAILWSGYVVWRLVRTPALEDQWGLGKEHFLEAVHHSLPFLVLASIFLVGYGGLQGHFPLPPTFWVSCLLYPFFGVAQQFALQVLVAKNLGPLVPHHVLRAIFVGGLFSLAHAPNYHLMILTFPMGVVLTRIYTVHPNLWAIGSVHGVIGALTYYVVLGLDPGAEIVHTLQQFLCR